MQTEYVLRVVLPEGSPGEELEKKINEIVLTAKSQLSALPNLDVALAVQSKPVFGPLDYEEDEDLSFLDEFSENKEGDWPNINSRDIHLLNEVQRVSELLLRAMSAPGQQTLDPMRVIWSVFPESAQKVHDTMEGELDGLDDLTLTQQALVVFLNHSSVAFTTIVTSYFISSFDLHKMFGLLYVGNTNIDCLLDFVKSEIEADPEFEGLPMNKEILVSTLEFLAEMFNLKFFSLANLPEVTNPMKDLSCLFGNIQKPNLTLIR